MTIKSFSLSLDKIILWMLVLSVCFFRYLGITSETDFVLVLLIVFSFFVNMNTHVSIKPFVFAVIFSFYILLNYIELGGTVAILSYNTWQILPSLLSFLYIFQLVQRDSEFVFSFITNLNRFFNIYLYLNIPFVLLQASGLYWLAGATNGHTNPLGVDMISGLFGFNGTAAMSLFVSFVMVADYDYYLHYCRASQRSLFIFLMMPLLIFYLVLPFFNDNKAFYLVLLFFLFVYFVSLKFSTLKHQNRFEMNLKQIGKLASIGAVFVLLVLALYQIEPIRNLCDKLMKEVEQGWEYAAKSHGSNERIGMIQFAFSDPQNLLQGRGIGTHTWTEPMLFGFWHYGQADIGTFLCLGGLIFVVLIMVFMYSLVRDSTGSFLLSLLCILVVIMLSVYTQLFTVLSLSASTIFFFVLCCSAYHGSSERI